jgi:hypothetical protein
MLDFIRRAWFPAALVLLLVLAIPGVLLFVLNLLGLEADVNGWLEKNLHLSYNIAIPWWGALLLLLVPLAIVILYFLKLKRKPIQVPSTFLWKKSIEDLHVNSLLQWLRQNVLLLLQILTVLALIYAIMAFRFHGRNTEGRHYIIMVDNSASMSCTDMTPSRLEWAKQEALKEIDAAGDNDYGMVIAFNSSAQTLQSRTSNRDLLRKAVKDIQPTQRPTRIEEALSLADSLANPSRSTDDAASRPPGEAPDKIRTYVANEGTPTEVHLYSDGRFPDVPKFALGNLRLQLHIAGKAAASEQENIGIVKLNAYRDESDPTKVQIFCRVINTRAQPAKGRVQIDVQTTGQVAKAIYEKPILLPPRVYKEEKEAGKDEVIVTDAPGESSVTFDLKDLDDLADITVYARLLDLKDNFPLDDEAWLVLGVVRKARILMVSKGNEILDKFFNDDVLKDVATLTRLKPDELAEDEAYLKDYLKPAQNGDFDLLIFDRWSPKKEDDMPRGNTFFVGQPPPGWKKPGQADGEGKAVEKVVNPHIKGWMSRHPLLRYLVALQEVGVAEAFKMKDLPPRTPLLIESDREMALLLVLNRQAFTDLVMTFPLVTDKDEWNTNWPLKPSFPLFLRNVLYTLGNVSDAAAEDTTQPGQVKTVRPDVGVSEVTVTDPAGGAHKLLRGSRADFTFGGTDQVGIYRVAWGGQVQRSFAVNLFDPEESNLEPKASVRIGDEELARGETRSQPRSMWKWIVLAALVFLMLEWYIYNRRVYI